MNDRAMRPGQPATVVLATLYDLATLAFTGLVALQLCGLASYAHAWDDLWPALAATGGVGVMVLASIYGLQTRRRWAWSAQVVLFVLIGLALLIMTAVLLSGALAFVVLGLCASCLVTVPLVAAWYHPSIIDWFAPPLSQDFGQEGW